MRGTSFAASARAFAACCLTNLVLIVLVSTYSFILSGCASVKANNPEVAAAKISVVPSSIDFKEVVVGQKNSQTIKVSNASTVPVDLETLRVSGTAFAIVANKAPVALQPGASVNLSVVFSPSAATAANGALVISSSDLKAPVTVPLSGSGEKSTAELQATPAVINFGSHTVNSQVAQSVTLQNTGNVRLTVNSINASNPNYFVGGFTPGVTLAPDQRLEFQVWFHPTTKGTSSATMTVSSPALPAPVKLAVSGTAAATTPPVSTPSTPAHSVTLDWNASTSSVSGYHVYRGGTSGGPYTRITSSPVSTLNYKDSSVQGGSNYFYVVTAIASDGTESAYSNEVPAEVPVN
jgi:hypothetical protein